jgi:hypothetical protein
VDENGYFRNCKGFLVSDRIIRNCSKPSNTVIVIVMLRSVHFVQNIMPTAEYLMTHLHGDMPYIVNVDTLTQNDLHWRYILQAILL